jgi:hypothetical protein
MSSPEGIARIPKKMSDRPNGLDGPQGPKPLAKVNPNAPMPTIRDRVPYMLRRLTRIVFVASLSIPDENRQLHSSDLHKATQPYFVFWQGNCLNITAVTKETAGISRSSGNTARSSPIFILTVSSIAELARPSGTQKRLSFTS